MNIQNVNNGIIRNGESTKKDKNLNSEFSKEIQRFDAKVKDRIKNGEPKYTMGRTSLTEDDWESLMKNIDSYMKKASELKEQEYEKIGEKKKRQSIEQRIYDKVLAYDK